ncbi:MAG TPA: CHAT domain-containing protein [Bryobacteraceae bacterium]|nr:CHAT domain-containing protein [Bryobacteraceae bacterium]HXJ41958.1 CHAT domain-containing protein [Bryobacteraceae bacterium]
MTGEIFTIGQTEQRCSTHKKGKVVHVGMGTFMLPFASLFVLGAVLLPLRAQRQPSATNALQHALHLADLYNWSDAAEDFEDAEKMFLAAGDQRNALYARLGKLRSNIQQRELPETSAQLAAELDSEPLLQTDKQLRMFCLIVKGDIDGEIDARAMRQDWEQVQGLARDLGDAKWQYRALAQLGLAAFYDGDLATARKNVGNALLAATASGDAGAQIRYLTALGIGLSESHMYEQALPYFENALKIASATPDAGYQYTTNEARLQTLIGLGQIDPAQRLAADILAHAQQSHLSQQQAIVLSVAARIARARKDDREAFSALERSIALSEAGGYIRELAEAQSLLSNMYLEHGDLQKAEQFATLAADSTQASGDVWSVPERLKTLAELQTSQGKYADADRVYDRAAAFIDSMIGNFSSVLEKTAVIRASSEMYSQHFSLVAERLNDPTKAYAIVEQVRGRITTDLLMAGSVTSDEAKKTERAVSQLRLKLRAARSTNEVRRVRDQIFMVEQSRWITPGISILKAQSHNTIEIDRVQNSLSASAVILEYVMTDPRSYCLVISRTASRIVPLASKHQIETLVADYLKAVKAKQAAHAEARHLYDLLVRPISEAEQKENLVVIRDGQLHLVPFDGLINVAGRYIAEAHTVIYAPSATSFYLLATQKHRAREFTHALLAVGGIPYNRTELKQVSLTRGYDATDLSNLPASKDEVLAAEAAIQGRNDTLLLGSIATEAAFKRADLAQYRFVHLAVHAFASRTDPDSSALVLLSDPSAGEDGFLQASEIVPLRLNAELVILSACDTAVGPVQGEEGIATLSRAFLLAGAKTVVSTLWSVDDNFSLFLMKHFYKHLAAHEPAAYALTAAKRDMLRKFGHEAVPYYWAGFTFEGVADSAISSYAKKQRANNVAKSKDSH